MLPKTVIAKPRAIILAKELMEYLEFLWLCTSLLIMVTLCKTGQSQVVRSECIVPPYSVSLHEVNVTAESETLLLTEGRCYLACLGYEDIYSVCVNAKIEALMMIFVF